MTSNRFREAWEAGVEYPVYRERVLALGGLVSEMLVESEATLAEATLDLTLFQALPTPIPVLVLSEDWCGDCTDNLPILDRIARETGKLLPRIASRDDNLDIMDQYLTRGEFRSIPVIIALNADWTPRGALRERPESVSQRRREDMDAVYAANPEYGTRDSSPALLDDETRERLYAAMSDARASSRGFAIGEVVRELGGIVQPGAAS